MDPRYVARAGGGPAPRSRNTSGPGSSSQGSGSSEPTRALSIALRVEPTTVSPKPFRQAGIEIGIVLRLFNAGLGINDEQEVTHPYLTEALPQLNTDTWRLLPDGGMETAYRLRPNLTWHDGAALTADDFVFAWNVFATPELGNAGSPPLNQINEVTAPDSRTVLVNWKRPYPYAGILQAADLPPLPRHILASTFVSSDPAQLDFFAALPFWTTEYVGVGPYKMDRWEPGAYLEATAFDGHTLGRAKIDKMRLLFISDPNTVLANLLSRSLDFAGTGAVYFQQATVIRREWDPSNAGKVLVAPGGWRYTHVQLRPELAEPRSLLDTNVRKALAYAIDRQMLNDGLFDGQGIMADTMVWPTVDYYATLDRAITKYSYDPRLAEQHMNMAGYAKGSDGNYVHPSEGRFASEVQVIAQAQNESEMSLMGVGWRQAGFEMREAVMAAAQAQSGEARAKFPGLFTSGGGSGDVLLANLATAGIPRPDNRWTGSNRGAWSNAEYDRLFEAFNTTLEKPERNRLMVDIQRLVSNELPVFSLYFQPSITAHISALRGPANSGAGWDVHTWTLN